MRRATKSLIRVLVATLFASIFVINNVGEAHAESCPTFNFASLFFEDYYPGTVWTAPGTKKKITWTATPSIVESFDGSLKAISRPFSTQEIQWLEAAINSWDKVLESISFERVNSPQAELKIAYTIFDNTAFESLNVGIWSGWWNGNIRNRATIRLKAESNFIQNQEGFIHAIQHEVGNVLGLGDIRPNPDIQSVLEDPWQSPYGPLQLSDFDIGLIRQLYGESTCPSSWKSATDDASPSDNELRSEIKELKNELQRVTEELEILKNQINELLNSNSNLTKKNKKLTDKLKRICTVKPKPKNC